MAPRGRGKKPGSRGASRGHLSRVHGRSGKPLATGGKPAPAKGRRRRAMPYEAFEREPATPAYMARLFAAHEFEVTDAELERFWTYYTLLRKHNAACDLTRIMGIEATVLKHFVDSAIVADMVKLPSPLLDIGTGAGFPGAPIAIRRPDLQVILAESRGKRVGFLETLKDELRLDNVTVHGHSVREDSDLSAGSVVTRALEVIPATLQRVSRIIRPGGVVVFLKGPNCGGEVTDAQQALKGVFKMSEDIRYSLPGTKQQRRLVAFMRRDD